MSNYDVKLAAALRRSNIFEWERLNAEQERRDRENLYRGCAWATLFSAIFWSVVTIWVAL